jgi:hypothetical protein
VPSVSSVFGYLTEVEEEQSVSLPEPATYSLSIRLLSGGGKTAVSEQRVKIDQHFESKEAAEGFARQWIAENRDRLPPASQPRGARRRAG